MSIILNPSKSLGFNRPLTRNVTCFINVTNPNAHPVYYKFKTTLPKGSTVRPNPGKVDPGQTVGVRVMLLALEEEPPLDTICRVKFLVQSILIPPEQVTVPLHELWSTLSIHSHKLKVNYLPPEGHPLDLSSHTTTVPGAISEPSSTVSPSKLEKPPEGTSNGPSTPLVQPIPVLNSDTEVAHAHKSDIVPPPESPWTPLYENPPPPYPVMPMDPSTDISSQREEAIVAPMIFHAQNYIAKRTSRKMTSCANSVSIDHTSSFLMARGTLPMETENACSSGTTISTQDSVGPRQEAVVAHVAGSGCVHCYIRMLPNDNIYKGHGG
ncbi:PapD-like protein [Russula earlei]|uniref:PapD-like protein n=1 Tax=Russula earlei TaxID=71964 RepID=A0ACC0UMY1_9AGAM|nr:PapD-like protein [Russula earlei]